MNLAETNLEEEKKKSEKDPKSLIPGSPDAWAPMARASISLVDTLAQTGSAPAAQPVQLSTVNPVQRILDMGPGQRQVRDALNMERQPNPHGDRDRKSFLRQPPNSLLAANPAIYSTDAQPVSSAPIAAQTPVATKREGNPLLEPPAPKAASAATVAPGKINWGTPELAEQYEMSGRNVDKMLQSSGPHIQKSLARSNDGKYYIRTAVNGGPNPPALKTPYLSPKAFSSLTGYDKDQNPMYSDGVAAMNAANAGIADYNNALLSGYDKRNDLWIASQPDKAGAIDKLKVPMEQMKNSLALASDLTRYAASQEDPQMRSKIMNQAVQAQDDAGRLAAKMYGADAVPPNPLLAVAQTEQVSVYQNQLRADLAKNPSMAMKKWAPKLLDSQGEERQLYGQFFNSLTGDEFEAFRDYVRDEALKRKAKKKEE